MRLVNQLSALCLPFYNLFHHLFIKIPLKLRERAQKYPLFQREDNYEGIFLNHKFQFNVFKIIPKQNRETAPTHVSRKSIEQKALYSQLMSSFQPSSIALPWINGFSALQDRYFPLSSLVGVKIRILVVTYPSMEILSFVLFIFVFPFHHVIVAGGREPVARHTSSTAVLADKGCLFPSMDTSKGRTEEE